LDLDKIKREEGFFFPTGFSSLSNFYSLLTSPLLGVHDINITPAGIRYNTAKIMMIEKNILEDPSFISSILAVCSINNSVYRKFVEQKNFFEKNPSALRLHMSQFFSSSTQYIDSIESDFSGALTLPDINPGSENSSPIEMQEVQEQTNERIFGSNKENKGKSKATLTEDQRVETESEIDTQCEDSIIEIDFGKFSSNTMSKKGESSRQTFIEEKLDNNNEEEKVKKREKGEDSKEDFFHPEINPSKLIIKKLRISCTVCGKPLKNCFDSELGQPGVQPWQNVHSECWIKLAKSWNIDPLIVVKYTNQFVWVF